MLLHQYRRELTFSGTLCRCKCTLPKVNLRFVRDKFAQLEMDILFQLSAMPNGHGLPWLAYQLVFLKRFFDAGYLFFQKQAGGMFVGSIELNPDWIGITPEGRAFVADLGLHKL